jgi:hypothetical protein
VSGQFPVNYSTNPRLVEELTLKRLCHFTEIQKVEWRNSSTDTIIYEFMIDRYSYYYYYYVMYLLSVAEPPNLMPS